MYESFAGVYDTFMEDVPYHEWAGWLTGFLKKQGINDGLVLDLGCGTGRMTRELAQAGYDMIGVDSSGDMLREAWEQEQREPLGILYLQQDMRSFELYGTVRAVVSCCDSLNYILEADELAQVFSLVNNYLDPEGVFLFDMNAPYKYRHLLGDRTFAESRDGAAFIWENTWYEEERMNSYDLTLFIEGEDGLYRKYTEEHYQKSYTVPQVRNLLRRAGMQPLEVYDAYTDRPVRAGTERVLWTARECGKQKRN